MARRLIVALATMALAACAATSPSREEAIAAGGGADALLAIEAAARAAYAAGDSAAAAGQYEALVKRVPGDPDYWYRLANSLTRQSRYDEAAFAYQRAGTLRPEDARIWHNLGIVRVTQAQVAFAEGVKRGGAGGLAFDDSLRLSTALHSLMRSGIADADARPADAALPGPGVEE